MHCFPVAFCIEVAPLNIQGCHSGTVKSIRDTNSIAVRYSGILRRTRTNYRKGILTPAHKKTLNLEKKFFFFLLLIIFSDC